LKHIKPLLLGVAVLFIAIFLISLLMPSRVMTVRTIVINAPVDSIYHQVADVNQWKYWQPFFKENQSQIKISNPAYSAEWEQNGSSMSLKVISDSAYSFHWSIGRSGSPDVDYRLTLSPVSGSAAIQAEWSAITNLGWLPWNKFSGIFMDQVTGPGYLQALEALKTLCENK